MLKQKNESTTSETLAALRLMRSDGVGPVTFRRLVTHFGSIEAALDAMPHMKKPIQPIDKQKILSEDKALHATGGQWITEESPYYPAYLSALHDAPPVISVLGQTDLLTRPMLAIVGSRNASITGRKIAATLARDLGRTGFVIVSGLARGIDAVVHEAALETGTIAVVANGVDVIYPPENTKLYDAIRSKGLILSENPVGTEPTAALFPRRNRIISGLCQGVIVIEAAARSGSLITARCALEQGREVFAIPGSPLDPRAAGPNSLIKTGQAQLIEKAQDVIDALGGVRRLDQLLDPTAPRSKEMNFALEHIAENATPEAQAEPESYTVHTPDQERQALLSCLSPTPCDIDQLILATGLSASRILALLVEFELTGLIARQPGNRVARVA